MPFLYFILKGLHQCITMQNIAILIFRGELPFSNAFAWLTNPSQRGLNFDRLVNGRPKEDLNRQLPSDQTLYFFRNNDFVSQTHADDPGGETSSRKWHSETQMTCLTTDAPWWDWRKTHEGILESRLRESSWPKYTGNVLIKHKTWYSCAKCKKMSVLCKMPKI